MVAAGLRLACGATSALDLTVKAVNRRGLRAVYTFELRNALEAGGHACPCRYHGTPKCTCNYIVLSVYEREPAADGDWIGQVVIHSNEAGTWLSVSVPPLDRGMAERSADQRLLRALAEVLLSSECASGSEVS